MAEESKDKNVKMVELVLDRPMITNGKALGWEIIDKKPVFTGNVTVPEDVAEDLKERMKVAQKSDQDRLNNNGQSIDAAPGGISVGGA